MSSVLRRAFVIALLLAVVVSAWLGWREARRRADTAAIAATEPDTIQAGMRAMTLWFASADGDSLVPESRDLREREGLHDRIASLVAALDDGPDRRGLPVLPPGTALLHAYLADDGLLTLDLSRSFQQGFRGGTRAEVFAVDAIVRTLRDNVPEVQRVLFTCGGAPLATLGGHLPLDRPVAVRAAGE